MRYSSIRRMDVTNGEGVGVALFVQGCRRHCYNCFNPQTWDFMGGKEWDDTAQKDFTDCLFQPFVERVSILGGEPLEKENVDTVTLILKYCKDIHRGNLKTWLWTGYNFNEVKNLEIMKYIDVLVDGEYIDSERDITLKFRGSKNQRLIDVQRSLQNNAIILYGS